VMDSPVTAFYARTVRDDALVIRRESDGSYRVFMPVEHGYGLACDGIPHPHSAVIGTQDNRLAIGRESDRCYNGPMSVDHGDGLACDSVPHPHGTIGKARGDAAELTSPLWPSITLRITPHCA
jgi:hypothetical protein